MENAKFAAKYISLALLDGTMNIDNETVFMPYDDEHESENQIFLEGLKFLATNELITYEEERERSRITSHTVRTLQPFFDEFIQENDISTEEDKYFRIVRLKITLDYISLSFDDRNLKIKTFQVDKPLPMMLSYAANNYENERVTYLEMKSHLKGIDANYTKGLKNEVTKDPVLKALCDVFIFFPSSDSIKIKCTKMMTRPRLDSLVYRFPEKSQK